MEPNLTECAVCHDIFTVPKLLPCSHILCRDCLVTWLQSQPQAACPLCRCAIVDPIIHEGRSVEEVADGFPTDLSMTAMVEAETLLSNQHVCCVCVDVAAVAMCLQCGDMFCQNCSNVHNKQSLSKHHEVEQLSSLTTEKLATHHPVTCPKHKDKVSELYCPSHDSSLCVLCATTTHRNCPELMSLSTKIGELTDELSQLDNKLEEALTTSDNVIRMLDKHVQELETDSQSALMELNKVCERLKAAIDARFLSVKKQTLDFVSEVTKKVTNFRNHVIQTRSKTVTQKKMTELYTKFTEHKHFKDMVTMAKDRSKELVKVDELPDNLQLNHKLTMSIDPQTVADIESNLSRLGDTTFTANSLKSQTQAPATKSTVQDNDPVGRRCMSGQRAKFDPMTATPSKGVDIETRFEGDKKKRSPSSFSCIITSLSVEQLYVADRENKSIKVCSLKSDRLISTLPLDVTPRQMTLVNDNLLAVTTDQPIILLIDVTNISRPRLLARLYTARTYGGITCDRVCSDEAILVVGSCDHDSACVDMMTLTGRHVRTIASSQNLPRYCYQLLADTQRDVLYVSDIYKYRLCTVQLSTGRLLSKLNHPWLNFPRYMSIDSAGNLYVATDSSSIMVGSMGGDWRVLLTGKGEDEKNDENLGGITVTDTSLIVAWGSGVVKRYDLISP